MTSKNTITCVAFLLILCFVFESVNLQVKPNQAIVPISITVQGKLIITDAENDNKSGENPTLNINLKVTPDISNSIVSGSKAIRIRTNLGSWKLTAQRNDYNDSLTNLNPQDILLSFTTQAGSKANSHSGKLLSPFDTTVDLSKISSSGPTDIVQGFTKTSLERDPKNQDNWFQLTSNYSITPDFFYEIGEWNTTVSYNLVSP